MFKSISLNPGEETLESDVAQILTPLKENFSPDNSFSKKLKISLLEKYERLSSPQRTTLEDINLSSNPNNNMFTRFKWAISIISVIAVFVGSTSVYAYNSKAAPGDIIYPLKKITEEVRGAVISDPIKKAGYEIKLAERRIEEAKKLMFAGKIKKQTSKEGQPATITLPPEVQFAGKVVSSLLQESQGLVQDAVKHKLALPEEIQKKPIDDKLIRFQNEVLEPFNAQLEMIKESKPELKSNKEIQEVEKTLYKIAFPKELSNATGEPEVIEALPSGPPYLIVDPHIQGFNPEELKPATSDGVIVKPGTLTGLNPQPEPPMPIEEVNTGIVNPGTLTGLNPQPEPPMPIEEVNTGIVNPGTLSGINPQPEPPETQGDIIVKPGILQGLNPQPEPPAAPITSIQNNTALNTVPLSASNIQTVH